MDGDREMKQLLRIAGVFLAAILIGSLAGYAFISLAPCNWFGSGFEGACGYTGLGYAILFGHAAAAISFALIMCLFKVGEADATAAPTALTVSWIVLFVLQWFELLAYALPISLDFVPRSVSHFLRGGFIVASLLLTPFRARHPALVLLALFPLSGPLLLGAALYLGKPSGKAMALAQATPG